MKWTEPPEPVPSWLRPDREVTAANDDSKLPPAQFFPLLVQANLDAGVPIWQSLRIAANAVSEVGWRMAYRGFNLFGWKLSKAGALAFAKVSGKPPRWFRAPGNKAAGATLHDLKGGDPPWCYYWAFDSLGEAFAKWRTTFVPRPKATDTRAALETHREQTGNYKLTGFLFWAGDDGWFEALCDAGYKGANTDEDPAPSVAAYRILVREAGERWAQARLRVKVDGAWGPVSQAACRSFQAARGLPATGALDAATLEALAVP